MGPIFGPNLGRLTALSFAMENSSICYILEQWESQYDLVTLFFDLLASNKKKKKKQSLTYRDLLTVIHIHFYEWLMIKSLWNATSLPFVNNSDNSFRNAFWKMFLSPHIFNILVIFGWIVLSLKCNCHIQYIYIIIQKEIFDNQLRKVCIFKCIQITLK
jgi:hypothetical protein